MVKVVINGVEILEGQTAETTEDGMTYDNPSITGARLINGVAIGTMDIGSAVSDALTFTLLNPYKSSFDGDTVDFYISPSESDELSTKEKIENEIGEDTYDEAISGIENVNEVEEASEEEEDPTEEDLADAELTESEIDDIQYLFFEGESDEFTDEDTDEAEEDTWRKVGRYYISSQKAVNGGVVLTCYDGFIKMHGMFIPTTRTATVQELYDDLRTQVLVNCGITIDSFDFDSEYNITVNWDFNCSYRQALGYFAGLVGGFATFDEEGTAGISFYSYTDNILLDSDLISFNENSTDEILVDGIRCSVSVDGLDGNIIEVGAGQSISFINPFVNETILDKTYTMYRGIRFSGASLAVKWDDSLIAGEFVRIFTEEEYKAYVGIGNAISEAPEGEDISDLKRNINSLGKVILISSQIIEFYGGEAVSAISSICESETEKENRIEDPLNYKLRRSLEKSTEAQEKAGQALQDAEDANKLADEALTASGDAMQLADAAQKAATSAQEAVETVQSDVSSLNTTVANAEAAIEQAKQAAATADVKATEAQTSVVKAQEAADNAAKAAADAQTTAESAIASSQTAQNTADVAVTKATAAATEAAAAKADAQTAQNEIDTLGERLTTLSNTMSADYARKSDLTEATANLETKISQNADSISLQASRITVIDETANNAASLAAEAQSLAEKAQADATQSLADAEAAQKAADDAALSAQTAQSEADAAKAAADTAQSVADKAAEDLAAAEADLATVSGRVDATEQDISDAQAKVAQAQAAADKAKADAETATQKATAAQTAADTAASNAAAAQTAAENAAKDAESAQALAASAEEAAQQKAAEAAASAAAAQAAANNAASEAAQAQSKADQAAEDAATAVTNANDAADKAAKAQSDLAAAQAELTAVTNRVGATEEEIAEAQAAVTAAQKSADDANKAAATAQGIADTAVANAQTAQIAADEAKSKAQAAQEAADNAKAAADAAQADVNALAVRVTTAETSITNNAEAIKLAATKEEVATTLAGYSTTTQMNSAIEQKANSITSEVSSTYATKTENQTALSAAQAAQDEVNEISDKTRSGFIETLSGSGFVQSTKTEDGGTAEVVVYGKSVQDGTPTPEAPVEIQSVESPKVKSCGKNLVDIKEALDYWGCTYTEENGIYTITYFGNAYAKPFIFTNTASIYTLSAIQTSVNVVNARISFAYVSESGGISRYNAVYVGDTSVTSSNVNAIYLNHSSFSSSSWSRTIEKLQVELGNTATDYEPYQANTATLSDIVLRSTPDGTSDRVIKDSDGLWKIERNVNRVIIDGTQTVAVGGTDSVDGGKYIALWYTDIMPDIINSDGTINQIENKMSDRFEFMEVSNWNECLVGKWCYNVGGRDKSLIFVVGDTSVTDVSSAQTWLATNPVVFDYALATPTYEILPDSIQAELNALTTYNPVTNVMVSDGVTPDVDVSFWTRDYRTKNTAEVAKTTAEQTADKFTWLVESGTSSSNFTLTDRVASLLSSEFQIDALTTFKNSATGGTSTVIDGGAIKANTISADKLNVTDLSALGATIGGFTISSGALLSNNKIGLYKNGSISVVGASSYTMTDGSTLYSTLECTGGTLFLDSNSSGTLDGSSASEGKFIIDFGHISGFGKGETSSWLSIDNMSKHFSISKGGRLYVRGTNGNNIFGVLGDAGIIQARSLHCYEDIIFQNASQVGTDDAPSGRHVLANNTSISFLNTSGTRVRGIGLGNTDNILIGDDSGTAGMYGYITAQNNIVFYAGTSHDQCFASIYDSGKRYFQSKPIYDRTTSSGTAVRVNSNGTLYRYSSSSMRYKEEITCQLSEELNPERLYDLNVWQYKYREGHLDKDDQRYGKTHIGLLAEDVKQHYPIAANFNEDGDVEDWSERYLIPPMLKLIQMQHEEIEAIKAELKEIRAS